MQEKEAATEDHLVHLHGTEAYLAPNSLQMKQKAGGLGNQNAITQMLLELIPLEQAGLTFFRFKLHTKYGTFNSTLEASSGHWLSTDSVEGTLSTESSAALPAVQFPLAGALVTTDSVGRALLMELTTPDSPAPPGERDGDAAVQGTD